MKVSWKTWPSLFCFCLSLCATGVVSQEFQLVPQNLTVLEGADAQFNATVTGDWQSMVWNVDGTLVVTILGSTISASEGYNASYCFPGNTGCVQFTIYNVNREQSSVTCTVQGAFGTREARLFVQVPKPTDWTVLIAVVVSIGGFALLVLLIIGIIFCCKLRKQRQATYQDEMSKRVRSQSEISDANAARRRHGQVNTGYIPDGQTSVTPSELADSDFSQTQISTFEMPDVVRSNQRENYHRNAQDTVDLPELRMHRHATIV